MQKLFKALAVVAMVGLTACGASSGTKIDASQIAQFQKGKSTYTDVVTALGKPTQEMVDDAGNRTINYMYINSKTRGETFIPIVGAFVGGADTENSQTTFTFNPKGVLTKTSQTTGNMGTNLGSSSK